MNRYYIKEPTKINAAMCLGGTLASTRLPRRCITYSREELVQRLGFGLAVEEPVKGLPLRSGWHQWTLSVAHTLHNQHLTSLESWHSGEALSRQPPASPWQHRLSRGLLGRLANQRRIPLTRHFVDEAVEAAFGGVVVLRRVRCPLNGMRRWCLQLTGDHRWVLNLQVVGRHCWAPTCSWGEGVAGDDSTSS
jgi:hypothetical protein